MELRVFVEPQQGASYAQLLRVALAAQELGFDGLFRSDHLLLMPEYAPPGHTGEPGPSEAWTSLAGLARDTTRLRLGTLVTSATFRHPALLAIQVAGVEVMSGGRIELGLGAGWYAAEHAAYGIDFPEVRERFDRFEEQLAIVTGLLGAPAGTPFSYSGRHYRIDRAPALPKPIQSPLPVIVGGHGRRRTPALAARYAAEFNVNFADASEISAMEDLVDRACTAIDRDPSTLIRSAMHVLACGTTDSEVAARAAAANMTAGQLRSAEAFAGSPAELVERIGRLADLGITRCYLQLNDLDDLDQIALVAAEVLPSVG
jgi:F420-dependent oxidoreductase-like protein